MKITMSNSACHYYLLVLLLTIFQFLWQVYGVNNLTFWATRYILANDHLLTHDDSVEESSEYYILTSHPLILNGIGLSSSTSLPGDPTASDCCKEISGVYVRQHSSIWKWDLTDITAPISEYFSSTDRSRVSAAEQGIPKGKGVVAVVGQVHNLHVWLSGVQATSR